MTSGLIAETLRSVPYPLNCFIYLFQYLMFDRGEIHVAACFYSFFFFFGVILFTLII